MYARHQGTSTCNQTPTGGDKCRHVRVQMTYTDLGKQIKYMKDVYTCCNDSRWCGWDWEKLVGVSASGMCCPAGTYCANSSGPKPLCCPDGAVACSANTVCCGKDESCYNGRACCKNDRVGCGSGSSSTCCGPGVSCLDPSQGTCCPQAGVDACGSKCCNATHPACDAATGVCCQAKGSKGCGPSLCCPANKVCRDPTTNPRWVAGVGVRICMWLGWYGMWLTCAWLGGAERRLACRTQGKPLGLKLRHTAHPPARAPRCEDCPQGYNPCGSACCNATTESCYDFDKPQMFAPICCPLDRQGCGSMCCAKDQFCVRPSLYGVTDLSGHQINPYCEACAQGPYCPRKANDSSSVTGCCRPAQFRGAEDWGQWACPDQFRDDGAVACVKTQMN